MTTHFKVCNCNRSMPLDRSSGEQLGAALGVPPLNIASELCRREIGSYLPALDGSEQVVVGCTQERALFSELAQQKNTVAPLRFVNLRESGGWGAQAKQSPPKMAALLAAAALPDPEPVPTVDYRSNGHVLIVGPAQRALAWAERLQTQLDVSVLLTDAERELPLERSFPLFSGDRIRAQGWLGAFQVEWQQANAIDLEICTRCNACIERCPEGAIDLSYQIDASKCQSHHDCVKACGTIGAIDFDRLETVRKGAFDLIFDLGETPLFGMHQPPQGYFSPGANGMRQADDALRLVQLVGEFTKPKFFQYKERLCAHGRNGKVGCTACIDVCSAEAVSHHGNQIKVNPNLCVGCGACTTVCPSGALAYAYPRATDLGARLKTMLDTFARAGGERPALLLHDEGQGAALILQLGRLARTGALRGVPARVMPVDLHHSASTGIDVWLSAIAWGATHVAVLTTSRDAPQYVQALREQIELAQTILSGLGYEGVHLSLIQADAAAELDARLAAIVPAETPKEKARFHIAPDKRSTLDLAIDHLRSHAPLQIDEIALKAGAPYGGITVDAGACTLCMSCVGACPESALTDNATMPQLRLIERNCVQCGLCEQTCPEQAITLAPRLRLTEEVRQAVVLNQAQPFHCIRCNKPFGTAQMIENMMVKLSAHGAFAGNTDRLKMCADCRVVDMMSNPREATIAELKRQ
ncbi:MAG TPA: 4Fe-4S binding protein [Oxalicibacterium sp.]|nr:4Fe-4S binding protein [Oxalicibacterium sp.]